MTNEIKFIASANKMHMPCNMYDIENIGEMLTDKNMYIMVNLANYKGHESITHIMNFISRYSTSYACLRCKKINKKYFICWSEHK